MVAAAAVRESMIPVVKWPRVAKKLVEVALVSETSPVSVPPDVERYGSDGISAAARPETPLTVMLERWSIFWLPAMAFHTPPEEIVFDVGEGEILLSPV